MQTNLASQFRNTAEGLAAEPILRRCVHCGFCLATCPTYQLLGNELDSPRGRIYLIKQVLEGQSAGPHTLLHLDRCLTCRACETTCPSGVAYGELAEVGRAIVEKSAPRPILEQFKRRLLLSILPYPGKNRRLIKLLRAIRPYLPGPLRRKIPERKSVSYWPAPRHSRRVLVFEGCAQPAFLPQINTAAARVLDRLNISAIRDPSGGCCGAMSQHMNAPAQARDFIRHNIDAWWPLVEQGIEAIAITASGCGATIKEYARLMADDANYASKASRITELARDLSEILAHEDLSPLTSNRASAGPIAFHAPCSLQHAQRVVGSVEGILLKTGFDILPVSDAHLCCGSAGTYSLLQPKIANRLRDNKLTALNAQAATAIATANIGCLLHLQSGTEAPVRHWIELIDARTRG